MLLMLTYSMKEYDQISISLIIGVLYAITDEIHQCFTPGRGPNITDVILDSQGVLVGILISLLCYMIYKKYIKG